MASLNPLTYAIEPIRYIYQQGDWSLSSVVVQAPWFELNFATVMAILIAFDLVILLAIKPLLSRRFA